MELLSKDVSDMIQSLDLPLDLPLDPLEVGLYLVITVDRDELVRLGQGDFCHTRLKTGSRRSGLTTKDILDRRYSTKFSSPTELCVM